MHFPSFLKAQGWSSNHHIGGEKTGKEKGSFQPTSLNRLPHIGGLSQADVEISPATQNWEVQGNDSLFKNLVTSFLYLIGMTSTLWSSGLNLACRVALRDCSKQRGPKLNTLDRFGRTSFVLPSAVFAGSSLLNTPWVATQTLRYRYTT